MKLRLNKWDNSLGFKIPKHIVDELLLQVDGQVECNIKNGNLVLKPIFPPEHTLKELPAFEIDPAPEVNWGRPMGKEVW